MNVSQPVFHGQVLFSSVCHKLSKAFQKVLVDHGVSPDVFIAGSPINQYLEFPTHEDVDEFCKAVCLAYDEQDETFRGSFRNMDNANKAMKELSIEAPANFNTQCRFSGPTSFYRKEGYIEFFRPVEIRAIRTVSKETHITVDGKVCTSTEETPVYSSWYESLPYRATVGFKTFSKISITKN